MNKKTKNYLVRQKASSAKKNSQGQKNKYAIRCLLASLLLVSCFLIFHQASAESISNIGGCGFLEEGSDKRKECEGYAKEIEIYSEIIDIKQQQSATLSKQISIADSKIANVQDQIETSKQKIDDFNSQISRIEKQIQEKNALMESQRKILATLVQSYYEVNLASPVISYLTDGNIASFIVKKDRIAQVGDKIKELVDSVRKTKEDFELQGKEVEKKKGEIVLMHEELKDQNSDLESVRLQKETLIVQTNGEEARYQQLLARVEAQKKELFDFNSASNINSVLDSIAKYPKPIKKYWASDWYFSQTDSRWSNIKIGGTNYLMSGYGCAITSTAMVFKFNGENHTPKTVLTSSEFIKKGQAIIYWPDSWYKTSFTKESILTQLKNNKVVIAHIKKGSTDGHFVVIHNYDPIADDYVVNDPYFGANLYLKTSLDAMAKVDTFIKTSINYIIITN